MRRIDHRGLPWIAAALIVLGIMLLSAAARAQVPDRLPILKEERARFGATVTLEEVGAVMARTAWRLRGEGFGLMRKTAGTRCPIPHGADIEISCDWLLYRTSAGIVGCDVLGAATGQGATATPSWCAPWQGPGPETFDPASFLAPVDPGGVVDPLPDPGLEEALKAIAQLRAEVADLREATGATTAALAARVTALEARPVPTMPVIACTEETINSSRSWGHAHVTRITVCRPKRE